MKYADRQCEAAHRGKDLVGWTARWVHGHINFASPFAGGKVRPFFWVSV